MAVKAEDRRVRRTRTLLQDALIALILEKGYEAVTVQDIIDRADVGRSTFYTHFLDKQQLLLSRVDELHVFLAQQHAHGVPSGEQRLSFSLAMFQHAQRYRHVYQALVGKHGGTIVLGHIQQMLTDLVRDDIARVAPCDGRSTMPREVVVQYVVGAFLALLTWWVDDEQPYTAEQMDALFTRLTLPGVRAG